MRVSMSTMLTSEKSVYEGMVEKIGGFVGYFFHQMRCARVWLLQIDDLYVSERRGGMV